MNKNLLFVGVGIFLVGCSSAGQENFESVNEAEIEKAKEFVENSNNSVLNLSDEKTVETIEKVSEIAEEKGLDADISVSNDSVVVETEKATVEYSNGGDLVVEGKYDEEKLELFSNLSLDEWCIEGQEINHDLGDSGVVSFTIQGVVDFKEMEYCLADGKIVASGVEVPTKFYTRGPEHESWVVTTIFGQEMEQKVIPKTEE